MVIFGIRASVFVDAADPPCDASHSCGLPGGVPIPGAARRTLRQCSSLMQHADFQIPRESTTLRAQVEGRLRAAILTGHFHAGQRLVERELCALFGVGRTSIREGLRQLEAEGLVTTVPHRGPTVSKIEYEDAEQLYAVRALLEGYAGQQFAELGSTADMGRLSTAVEAFEEATKSPDRNALLDAKTQFYAVLMEGCGNVFIRQMLTLLHNRINLLRATSMMQPGRLDLSMAEIREIRDAICARDGARAAAACRHHIEMAARSALSYLRHQST
jgi:DNA-binding GntR family transcriptional regulator